MKITSVNLRWLRLPLVAPYRLSYRTFTEFEPFYVEIRTDDGRHGFGDGHISPGSSAETRDGGWAFASELAEELVGMGVAEARRLVESRAGRSKVAASAFATALEVLEGLPILDLPEPVRLPLLVPVSATDPDAIGTEIEQLLEQGFRTFKVKVGKDVEADLRRVSAIQAAVRDRATLRLDANRAFDREQGCRFASALDPTGIELFEQPCAAEDWDTNAAVARVSTVPLMLDEPICDQRDIDRAAAVDGVRLCKLKLKRFGSMTALHRSLQAVRACGMEPVLGDGLGSDITSWMEACVARDTIRNAGEFNGFLKATYGLLTPSLGFEDGAVVMPAGYQPRVDPDALERSTVNSLVFRR
jgi:L-alanine-DL-glutamate epimerase-like enolase superfamily enzyme